jgi:hypothetical protein
VERVIVINDKWQSESKKSGDEFELNVLVDLKSRGFTNIEKNVYIPGTGCIEAKGGNDGDKKRPGARRTDNVKKAIANASLIKAIYPDITYVIYFSAKAQSGSYSSEMIKVALAKHIVDEIRYLEQSPEIDDTPTLF